MKILAVDTALGACSTALTDGAKTLARRFVPMERGHAEALAPMVEDVMREAGIRFSEIDRLAVTTGPGTFTGQRVGLAFMRGLRLALKRPLIGVTTLEAMAVAAREETALNFAAALHDAKRGEFYFQMIGREGALFEPRIGPLDEAVEAIASAAKKFALAGTGAEAAAEALHARNIETARTNIAQPDALWVARLAAKAIASDAPVRPLYLRPPDAKLPAAS